MADYYQKIAARLNGANELLRPALPSRFEPVADEGHPLHRMRPPSSDQQSDGEEQNELQLADRQSSDEGSAIRRPRTNHPADHHRTKRRDDQPSGIKENRVTIHQLHPASQQQKQPQRAAPDATHLHAPFIASPKQSETDSTPNSNAPVAEPETSRTPSTLKPPSEHRHDERSSADGTPNPPHRPPLRPSAPETSSYPAQLPQQRHQPQFLAETLSARRDSPRAPTQSQKPLRPAAPAPSPPPLAPLSREPATKREPTIPAPIEISIGRIEIVATMTAPRPPVPAPRPSTPALSLEAYLSQRNGSVHP